MSKNLERCYVCKGEGFVPVGTDSASAHKANNDFNTITALEQKVERLTEKYRRILRCASDNCGAYCGDMQGNDCEKALKDTEGE